jgi:hypothetical protein
MPLKLPMWHKKNDYQKQRSFIEFTCNSYAPPLQSRTKVGASPIFSLFIGTDLQRT